VRQKLIFNSLFFTVPFAGTAAHYFDKNLSGAEDKLSYFVKWYSN
jgi:hypothetical protein